MEEALVHEVERGDARSGEMKIERERVGEEETDTNEAREK